MSLLEAVHAVFEPQGVLAQMGSHYLARDGQIRMAEAVARTIVQGGALVVEAGTGVRKTFFFFSSRRRHTR